MDRERIFPDQYARAFEFGCQVFHGETRLKDAVQALIRIGMKGSTADEIIRITGNLLEGKTYKRGLSSPATDAALEKILGLYGREALRKAVRALEGQVAYQQELGAPMIALSEVLAKYRRVLAATSGDVIYPDEVRRSKTFREGSTKTVTVNVYERSSEARAICIAHFGALCQVCGIKFEDTYGAIGAGFIHVHHLKDLASIGEEYVVDPLVDLRPVCPNCHSMLHMRKPTAYSIEELRAIMAKAT